VPTARPPGRPSPGSRNCSRSTENFRDKKKRGGVSLLSGVGHWNSAYERLQIFLGLPNFVRFLRALRLVPGRGSSTPALFIDVFRPSNFPGLGPFRCRLPELSLLSPGGFSGSHLPTPNPSRPESLPVPTFASLNCLRSFSLLRPEPPGVYLQGSRIPFESPSLVRPAFAGPGLGDMPSTTWAFSSVFCYPPVPSGGSAVRPAGFI
jgi:hypothetical protein